MSRAERLALIDRHDPALPVTRQCGLMTVSRSSVYRPPAPASHVYLVAILDWHSRAVLAWRLSNTLGADFCVEALEEALARFGRPEIFNTDQGSQFTSDDFTGVLSRHEVTISMDGKGRCMDNIFIDRLLRTFKYQQV